MFSRYYWVHSSSFYIYIFFIFIFIFIYFLITLGIFLCDSSILSLCWVVVYILSQVYFVWFHRLVHMYIYILSLLFHTFLFIHLYIYSSVVFYYYDFYSFFHFFIHLYGHIYSLLFIFRPTVIIMSHYVPSENILNATAIQTDWLILPSRSPSLSFPVYTPLLHLLPTRSSTPMDGQSVWL